METRLAAWIKETPDGREADAILRSCVHCGFCTATCPTYQLLGDELDGPRGRIYQIKQVLEGAAPTRSIQVHLDRCLTCRSCETTCPSSVQYGRLLEIGRRVVDEHVERPLQERWARPLLRYVLSRRRMFSALLWIGRLLRPILPSRIKAKIVASRSAVAWPARRHSRRVIFINSCTQGALMPSVDAAAARVLDALGVEATVAPASACCGAVAGHTGDHGAALDAARRNVHAWWPAIEAGAEAIIATASACGLQIKDYGRALADDTEFATKARRVSELTMDLSEWIAPRVDALTPLMANPDPDRVVFHAPCTLQHGLRRGSTVEGILRTLGAQLMPVRDSHLCCGSAGTYSLLQPAISGELRDRKLQTLLEGQPRVILSANVGCLAHLESGTVVPVRHWIEWVAARMAAPPP